jgi:hypothetical protein
VPPPSKKTETAPTKPIIAPPKPKEAVHKPISNGSKEEEKPKLIWSDYQERQVNTFIDMGFMTKIEENEEEPAMEVIEDDDMFNEDDSNK